MIAIYCVVVATESSSGLLAPEKVAVHPTFRASESRPNVSIQTAPSLRNECNQSVKFNIAL